MNIIQRVGVVCAITVSVAALAGCDENYGYGGPAVGYGPGPGGPGAYGDYGPGPGPGAGYDGYYDGYYGGYGDPYSSAGYPGYFGWYGGFYYPGSGIYVYDRYRRPYRWNGNQQHYWSGQRRAYGSQGDGRNLRGNPNWGGFNRSGGGAGAGAARPAGQAFRGGGNGPAHGGGGHRR